MPAVGTPGRCCHTLPGRGELTWLPGAQPGSGLPNPANRAASQTQPRVCCPAQTPQPAPVPAQAMPQSISKASSVGQGQGHHRSPPCPQGFEGARGQPCQTQVTSPPGTGRGACATGTHRVSCTHRHLIFQLCLLLKSICYNFHFAVRVSGSATAI